MARHDADNRSPSVAQAATARLNQWRGNSSTRRCPAQRCLLLAVLLAAGPSAQATSAAQTPDDPPAAVSSLVTVPRDIMRPLVRAQDAIADGRLREAAVLLGDLLASQAEHDYLIAAPAPATDSTATATVVSLREYATRLLGSIPPGERATYELKYNDQARQQLDRAIAESDMPALAQVVECFFHTPSGHLATMLVAHYHLQRGENAAAIVALSRIADDNVAQQTYQASASVMLATGYWLMGDRDRAREVLVELKRASHGDTLDLAGRSIPFFADEDGALDWLEQLVGPAGEPLTPTAIEWLMPGGHPSRSAASNGSLPLAAPRWIVPTILSPDEHQTATRMAQQRLTENRAAIPATEALAIGETIVVRGLHHLFGVDLRTGKRLWAYPPLAQTRDASDGGGDFAFDQRHLAQRLWRDHVFGRCSSNGRAIFVIDEPGFAANQPSAVVTFEGQVIADPLGARSHNQLAAVDLENGELVWTIGGEAGGDEPRLAGALFLGAALPVDDALYVLCQLDCQILLVAVDQQRGQLIWSQPLASTELCGPVEHDELRRLAGASPALGEGILVCPTSVSSIVAVDVLARRMKWAYELPGVPTRAGTKNAASASTTPLLRANPAPVETTPVVAEGTVVVMPVESDRIFGLDLLTGRSLWNEGTTPGRPRGDALLVGCIHNGAAIVVGSQSVRALRLADGAEQWQLSLEPYGQPSGRGTLCHDSYLVPTASGHVLAIGLETGELVEAVAVDRPLGNLICYSGDVISHSADAVAAYPQSRAAQQIVAEPVPAAAPPDLIAALNAQLVARDGHLLAALSSAEQAYEAAAKETNAQLLTDLLIQAVRENYEAVEALAARHGQLAAARRPDDYLAARVDGLAACDRIAEALAIALEYFAQSTDDAPSAAAPPGGAMDRDLSVQFDRWLAGRLRELWQAATRGDPATCDAATAALRGVWTTASGVGRANIARALGPSALPADCQLELADWWLGQQEWLATERALAPLFQHSEPAIRAAADERYARLLAAAGKSSETSAIDPPAPSIVWPYTGLAVATADNPFEVTSGPRLLNRVECRRHTGRVPAGLLVAHQPIDNRLVVFDRWGQRIVDVALGGVDGRERTFIPFHVLGSYVVDGHLLIAAWGVDVVAIDLFRAGEGDAAVLWRTRRDFTGNNESTEKAAAAHFTARGELNSFGNARHWLVDAHQRVIGGIDMTPGGELVLANANQLVGLDPVTGERLWQRRGIVGSDIIAAADEIVVVDAESLDESRVSADSLRFTDANRVPLEHGQLWDLVDDGILAIAEAGDEIELRCYNLASRAETWRRRWPQGTLASIVDRQHAVFLTPEGTLSWLRLSDGQSCWTTQLADVGAVESLEVQRRGDDLLVVANRNRPRTPLVSSTTLGAQIRPVNYVDGLIDGWVYLLSASDGQPRWLAPVRLEQFWMPSVIPAESPVLVAVQMLESTTASDRRTKVQVACFDERNGQLSLFTGPLPLVARCCEVRVRPELPQIGIDLGDVRLDLRFSDEAPPPRPPAQLKSTWTLDEPSRQETTESESYLSVIAALDALKAHVQRDKE